MAKFRARTLRWRVVDSDEVVGYKIYWSKGDKLTYDSKSVYVQDISEIVIPDALEDFVPEPGVYMFGITSIDQWGNESDLTHLKEPFHFSVPPAPEMLWVVPISVPSAPSSLWIETNDRRVSGDRRESSAEDQILMDYLRETDDSASND